VNAAASNLIPALRAASSPTSSEVAQAYAAMLSAEAPRVLGMLDRDPTSRTRGCFDRLYWAWKFTDFSQPRMQEGLCYLAFLYRNPLPGLNLAGDTRLADWIAAGFEYWASLQHSDGSFDEAYPFERSLAATAFTGYYLAEALALVEEDLPSGTVACVRSALTRGADWLCRNDETHGFLSNHLAAAAAALQMAHRLDGETRFARRASYFLEKILTRQSDEGWYDEYGGADPGYQTHGTFYLARILKLTGDAALGDALARACRFQACFVHPDGTLGGEYASRNTQTYYPAGFEMLSATDGAAAWIARTMAPQGPRAAAVGLRGIDPGNYFPMLNNHVFAYRACLEPGHRAATPQPPPEGMLHFPKAGLARLEKHDVVAYIGLTKGGVVKAFDRRTGRLIVNDCGYFGRLRSGKPISSQARGSTRVVEVNEDRATVEGHFYRVGRPVMKPGRFLLFRVFMLTVGRLGPVARWIKQVLVTVLIHRQPRLTLRFRRTIRLTPDGGLITDEISGPGAEDVAELSWGDFFTTIHMGSSRYAVPHETGGSWPQRESIDVSKLAGGLTITHPFRRDGS
jgi:hypothetical protein